MMVLYLGLRLPPSLMSTSATIADIAARAGVGTATVDRVLNKRPGVNADTMQRVMQVVAELGAPPLRGRGGQTNFSPAGRPPWRDSSR